MPALPEVAAARARRSVKATVQVGGTWRQALVFALDDFSPQPMARLSPLWGAWPPADGMLVVE